MPAPRALTRRPRSGAADGTPTRKNVSRRKFLGYVVAAPTLVVAAEIGRQSFFDGTAFGAPNASAAAIPSPPQTPELYEFVDSYRDACRPTANLIKVAVNPDGTVSFALPRSDNGQGILTSTAMTSPRRWASSPSRSTSRWRTPARS